jgi:tetratricopeptide (TPR) repeat protein
MTKTPTPIAPEALKSLLEQAASLHSAGRLDEAAAIYARVESGNPEALAATYFNGLIDVETGRLNDALKRFRRVVAGEPAAFNARRALAYTLRELGRWGDAEQAYRQALEIKPDSAAMRFDLGWTLEVLGRLDEAVATYRELAAETRTRARALSRVAHFRPSEVTSEEMVEMAGMCADPELPLGLRIALGFGLGELLERRGRYDEAFEAFSRANASRRAHLTEPVEASGPISIAPPSARPRAEHPEKVAEEHQQWIDFTKAVFTPELFARHAAAGSSSNAPIFVVGMPRSGSTLLEQILSSHRQVQGLGECAALPDTIMGQYPIGPASDGPGHFRDLAKAYLDRLRALGWNNAPHVVDKMLSNYLFIGMIHLMFPKAVILHSVRDPVDTCLANFRKLFRTAHETSYDLGDIGRNYVRYRQMMDHWEAVLPGRVTSVSHEALVTDAEPRIRQLISLCPLKWDPACLEFHKTDRVVRTASVAQVRQPIFSTSVERWRRYERHLGPLFEALGPYAPKAG